MYLQLADSGSQKVYIPNENGGGYNVPISFFDKLNDYEFSGLFTELLQVNNFDLGTVIKERDQRRAKIGLPSTNYQVPLSSKFGDWFKQAGDKISAFFKPTNKGNAIPLIQPDGSISYAYDYSQPQQSGFTSLLQNLATAFGFYTPPQPQQQQQSDSLIDKVLPLAAVGVAGLALYKVFKNK